MFSIPRLVFTAHALAAISLLSTTAYAAPSSNDTPSRAGALAKRNLQYSGCYSSSEGLTEGSTYLYQTSSYCAQQICTSGQSVLGLTGGDGCYCGDSLPPASSKVDNSKCSIGCTGFGTQKCGGNGFFSVYLTGNGSPDSTSDADDSSSSSTSSSPTSTQAAPSVVTSIAPGQTVVVTQPAKVPVSGSSDQSGSDSSGGGSNTTGIAAGVVAGIVVLAGIIAGAYFYIRRRRQLAVEEEHRQRSQVSDFIAGGAERKPLGSGYSHSHGSDARLDPEAGALRRNSVGSFVADDSQDYSRKILRVANPDSS